MASFVKNTWQDFFVAVLCSSSFGAVSAFMFTIGLLQSAWEITGSLTSFQASFINSVSFCLMCSLNPFVQSFFSYLDTDLSIIYLSSALSCLFGLICSSFSSKFWELLIFNSLFSGFCVASGYVASFKTLYKFYVDKQLYLFSNVMFCGQGLGIDAACLIFYVIGPEAWRSVQRVQCALLIPLLLSAIVFSPRVYPFLGIRTREDKDPFDVDAAEERTPIVVETSTEGPSSYIQSASLLSGSFASFQKLGRLTFKECVVKLFTNRNFVFALMTYTFGVGAYDVLMTIQPVKMLTENIDTAPQLLAINGVIIAGLRILIGYLIFKGLVTPTSLCIGGRVLAIVSTIACNLVSAKVYQEIYFVLVGLWGAAIISSDFLLITECVREGRELAVAFYLLFVGLHVLIFLSSIGKLYEYSHDYYISYNLVIVSLIISLVFIMLYTYSIRKRKMKRRAVVKAP